MKTPPLAPAEIQTVLGALPGWAWERDALAKEFRFADFRAALAFMVRAGFEAEALDHHPEWTNIYNRVAIRLNTHSAGGKVTAKDVELARRMEQIFDPAAKG
jgi:4a-hydroxytetrahydrobiopterin dehydratase